MSTPKYKCESLNIKMLTVDHEYESLNINVNLEWYYIIVEYLTACFWIYLNQCVEHMKVNR